MKLELFPSKTRHDGYPHTCPHDRDTLSWRVLLERKRFNHCFVVPEHPRLRSVLWLARLLSLWVVAVLAKNLPHHLSLTRKRVHRRTGSDVLRTYVLNEERRVKNEVLVLVTSANLEVKAKSTFKKRLLSPTAVAGLKRFVRDGRTLRRVLIKNARSRRHGQGKPFLIVFRVTKRDKMSKIGLQRFADHYTDV
jgi:hypothetical protein